MFKPKTMSVQLANDSLDNLNEDIYKNLGFIITVIRDNTQCDETFYLLDKLVKRL